MSEINELEQALVIVAANADSRNYQEQNSEHEQEEVVCKEPTFYKSITNDAEIVNKNINKEKLLKSKADTSPEKRKTEEINGKKCRLEEISQICTKNENCSSKTVRGYANVVANHYNQLQEKGLDERFKSRIVYLRNFHNWIKSILINEYLTKIKEKKKYNDPIRVHDMCSGKGGDLLKWKKGSITHLICSDIAAVSLDQCKARYEEMKNRSARDRSTNIYTIEYIAGDCSRIRLREKYSDPSMKIDLVSCQFAFHYSFESLPQAECMLRNAAECLQPGGFFIGTIPDAYDLVARAKKSKTNTFGNNVYEVAVDFDVNKPPLFGGRYNFQLDGVVNCPEFLVYFPVLVKLAKKFGLKFVKAEKFYEYFERMKEEGKYLLKNMRGLEAYPPPQSATLNGTDLSDYVQAEEFVRREGNRNIQIGTLSKSEWEVSSLYTTFVFQKVKNTWNTDGTPVYDI